MSDRIQKRVVIFEIISKGDKPVDLNDIVQDALLAGVHKAISSTLNLRYENKNGGVSHHEFVGVDIKEIK